LHALGTIWAVCGRPDEIDRTSNKVAGNLVASIGDNVLERLTEGDSIAISRVPVISRLMQKILSTLVSSSVVTARRSGTHSRRAALQAAPAQTAAALQTIANLERLSRINVAGHALGQSADVTEDTSYRTTTQLITESMLSNMTRSLVGETTSSSSLSSPQVVKGTVPRADFYLPPDVSVDPNLYEVQTTLLYTNPLAGGAMALECLDESEKVLWDSGAVDVATDVMGTLTKEVMRANVATYRKRRCSILGNAVIFNIRPRAQLAHVKNVGSKTPIRMRLPFDPLLRSEARTNLQDKKSGHRTTVSCVYWNDAEGEWSSGGIQYVGMSMGNSTSQSLGKGAYVDCESSHLSTFSVSEVPADCEGTPFGTTEMDECGVCGGDNSLCSGCDGAPNSGRTKDCSGHGQCAGDKCKCDPFYYGIVCQVFCDSAVNCSGYGECKVEFEGLSMVTTSYCECQAGYSYPSPDDYKGMLPVATCVEFEEEMWSMPDALFYSLTVGAPGFLVCTACFLFWCCISRKQAQRIKTMQDDLERYMVSYDQANQIEGHEVDVDLCLPLGPACFDETPTHGDEKPLTFTFLDKQRISEAVTGAHDDLGQELDQDAGAKHKLSAQAFFGESESSDEDPNEEDRAERLRKIRAMRQTVARSVASGGPRRSANGAAKSNGQSNGTSEVELEVAV